MNLVRTSLYFIFFFLLIGCKEQGQSKDPSVAEKGKEVEIKHASGLSITEYDNYSMVVVENPWPNAERSYRYLLAKENAVIPEGLVYDQKVEIPVDKIVVTSTTHIPSLETLGEEKTLIGFPGLDYISSEKTRRLISEGKVREVGQTEVLNTETLLDLNPEVVVGFSVDGSNKSLNTIQKSGIPVIFNSDWTESSPLGKAEWIKFFGALYDKMEEATKAFNDVERSYVEAKELAKKAEEKPTVMAGSMYKDQWFLPAGDSWNAAFIEDANAKYIFEETEGTGSLSLSLENVLAQASNADVWIGPAQFTSYEEMKNSSPHYQQFQPFQERNVYTFSSAKGETGGVIFYELAPNRPDLVLKDLIHIFHPTLLPNYETTFYKPLK